MVLHKKIQVGINAPKDKMFYDQDLRNVYILRIFTNMNSTHNPKEIGENKTPALIQTRDD